MLWNFAMHALMGFFGAYFFMYTPEGIGMALLVVCITQGVDQIRIKKDKYREVEALPKLEQLTATKELDANIKSILIKIFIQNVLMFTALVLISADVARTYG